MINIFVTVGSGPLQFERLIKVCDNLDAKKYKMLIQKGSCNYIPKNYKYIDYFKNNIDFQKTVQNTDIVIGHGGAGTIIDVLSKGKKLIVVPRLKKYKEAVDDHQIELAQFFEKQKKLYLCLDEKELENKINYAIKDKTTNQNKNSNLIIFLKEYISKLE